MNDAKSHNSNVELLDCMLDPDDAINPNDSRYRFLVEGKSIKYVMVAPGALGGDSYDRAGGFILLSKLLPPFPPGDWNQGYVDKDSETGAVGFVTTEKVDFPAVKNVWHPMILNLLDFAKEQLKDRVCVGTNPEFHDGKPVLLKFAGWPEEIAYMESETTVYEYIDGQGIGPGFLGHLTEGEHGRVIGIVIEWVPDARPAERGDLEVCKKALRRLHELGIKLGDTNRYNFLVREGQEVVLIDFESAEKCSSDEELEGEMNGLEASLVDTRFFGGYTK